MTRNCNIASSVCRAWGSCALWLKNGINTFVEECGKKIQKKICKIGVSRDGMIKKLARLKLNDLLSEFYFF